jgi:hypothetical protein
MKESDWDLYLKRLVEETKAAIGEFTARHGGEEVCYFAYDSEPRYGYVLTCFNTSGASLEFARKQREYHTQHRRKLMADPIWFDDAYQQAKANALLPFCNNTGDFAYQGFTQIQFPEWQEYAESTGYRKRRRMRRTTLSIVLLDSFVARPTSLLRSEFSSSLDWLDRLLSGLHFTTMISTCCTCSIFPMRSDHSPRRTAA